MMSGEMTTETTQSELDSQWDMLLHWLPRGWQDAAWTFGAITRLRAIQSAEALLRLILAYSWNDWSLRTTAAWARRINLADVSDVAVLKRLCHAPAWLGHLLDQWFRSQGIGSTIKSRFRLILTDGSTIQRPGSPGTTWRLHAQWNLGTGQWEHVELTDAHGAESLTRLHLQPNDVVLADRNYAKPNALSWIATQKAHVIARFWWNALRFQTRDGKPWSGPCWLPSAHCRTPRRESGGYKFLAPKIARRSPCASSLCGNHHRPRRRLVERPARALVIIMGIPLRKRH